MRPVQAREACNKPWKARKAVRHVGRPNLVKKVQADATKHSNPPKLPKKTNPKF